MRTYSKPCIIHFRVSQEQNDFLELEALQRGCSVSDTLRDLIDEYKFASERARLLKKVLDTEATLDDPVV